MNQKSMIVSRFGYFLLLWILVGVMPPEVVKNTTVCAQRVYCSNNWASAFSCSTACDHTALVESCTHQSVLTLWDKLALGAQQQSVGDRSKKTTHSQSFLSTFAAPNTYSQQFYPQQTFCKLLSIQLTNKFVIFHNLDKNKPRTFMIYIYILNFEHF